MRTECERCGDCCKAGGPALHGPDKALFESGVLEYRQVYVLRAGEVAHEQVRGGLVRLGAEIVKVKSARIGDGGNGAWACGFLDPGTVACAIYEQRPAECRALKCWDTAELEAMYDQDRLTRFDLVRRETALGEIMADHERMCPVWRMWELARALEAGDQAAAREILSLVRYDESMRSAFMYKAGVGPEYLDFFFGRALASTVGQFGLELEDRGGLVVRLLPFDRRPRLMEG